MSKWNLNALKAHIEQTQTDPKAGIGFVESISRTIQIYKYHECEVFPFLNNGSNIPVCDKFQDLISMGEKRIEHEEEMVMIQAHIQAALYNVRAMYDLFAQLLNMVLLSSKYEVSACNINKVFNVLPKSSLKDELDTVLCGFNYQYVNSFINTIKHRNLLKCSHTLDFIDDRSEIKVSNFQYQKNDYEEKWGSEVLTYAYELTNQLINLGESLNEECGVKYA